MNNLKEIGTIDTRFGRCVVLQTEYLAVGKRGQTAVLLQSAHDRAPVATLSVNMPDTELLPSPSLFYAKEWSENRGIAVDAINSGLFKRRPDFPMAVSGFVSAQVWEIL